MDDTRAHMEQTCEEKGPILTPEESTTHPEKDKEGEKPGIDGID